MKKKIPMTDETLIALMMRDRAVRSAVTRESMKWFFAVYFREYLTVPLAAFHHEMIHLVEDDDLRLLVILAFRDSGKSTLMNLVSALWHILGRRQSKFVLVVSRTIPQAKQHIQNIKYELEKNELLRADLGPFEEEDEWNRYALTLPHYGAKIMAISTGQSIRGLRYLQHRPDIIICDDLEDYESVRTRESRAKTYEWVMNELLPATQLDARVVFLGNLLHEDALLRRLYRQPGERGSKRYAYREYPLLDDEKRCLWPERFPNEEAIQQLRDKIADDITWNREYLLRIIADASQVIHPDWIQRYDYLPPRENRTWYITGVDLAISERESADFTAMVSLRVDGFGKKMKIYVLPNPINRRLTYPQTIEEAQIVSASFISGHKTELAVEDVGYQRSLIQHLSYLGIPATSFQPKGQDKRSRLALVSHLVQDGTVLFPISGAEELIEQLVGFGRELHDDLADAFAIAVHKVLAKRGNPVKITFAGGRSKSESYRQAHLHYLRRYS